MEDFGVESYPEEVENMGESDRKIKGLADLTNKEIDNIVYLQCQI